MPAMIWDWEDEQGKIPPNLKAKIQNKKGIVAVVFIPARLDRLVETLGVMNEVIEVEDGSTIVVVREEME